MKNKKIEKLELENSKLEDKISKLRQETRTEVSSFIKKHYFPFVNRIEFDHGDYFRLYNKERNEICTLSLRGDTYSDPKPTHIVLGYYSSQTKSDNRIELDRLVSLGTVSNIISIVSNEIIEDTRTLSMKNSNSIKKLRKQSWELEKEIAQLEKEDRENKRIESLDKLFKEGIEFNVGGGLKGCAIRNDHYVRNIKKIKFLRWTNENQLSLSVEITTAYPSVFKDKDNGIDDSIEVYNKVRLFNLDHFINLKALQIEENVEK